MVGKVESVRVSDGLTRHYIMSRKMSPKDFLKAVRNRWAIENRLHWVLDVQMREDDLRNRAGRGPENLAGVRRLVVNIMRLKDNKLSFRRRFLRVAQVPEYRLKLIANTAKIAEALRSAMAVAAGRVPLHDAPDHKGRNMLTINNKMEFLNFRSYS